MRLIADQLRCDAVDGAHLADPVRHQRQELRVLRCQIHRRERDRLRQDSRAVRLVRALEPAFQHLAELFGLLAGQAGRLVGRTDHAGQHHSTVEDLTVRAHRARGGVNRQARRGNRRQAGELVRRIVVLQPDDIGRIERKGGALVLVQESLDVRDRVRHDRHLRRVRPPDLPRWGLRCGATLDAVLKHPERLTVGAEAHLGHADQSAERPVAVDRLHQVEQPPRGDLDAFAVGGPLVDPQAEFRQVLGADAGTREHRCVRRRVIAVRGWRVPLLIVSEGRLECVDGCRSETERLRDAVPPPHTITHSPPPSMRSVSAHTSASSRSGDFAASAVYVAIWSSRSGYTPT